MNDDPNRQKFEAAYLGKPPWDLGRPQRPFVEAADQITGSVLDPGCGTGENLLYFAERGQAALGVDFVDAPLAIARGKARDRGLLAEFREWDVRKLVDLGGVFDSVIDCGLFHVLSDDDRLLYVDGLSHVVRPGGRLFLMCFSDEEPAGVGPRRISRDEIRSAFADGWHVQSISATRFEVSGEADPADFSEGGPKAWFAIVRRQA